MLAEPIVGSLLCLCPMKKQICALFPSLLPSARPLPVKIRPGAVRVRSGEHRGARATPFIPFGHPLEVITSCWCWACSPGAERGASPWEGGGRQGGNNAPCYRTAPGMSSLQTLCRVPAWCRMGLSIVGRASGCLGRAPCPSAPLSLRVLLSPSPTAHDPPAGHHQHEPVHGRGGRGEPDRAEILLVHPDAGEGALHPS